MNCCYKYDTKYPRYTYGRNGIVSGIQRIIDYYRNNKKF